MTAAQLGGIGLAALIGALLPLQALINARLGAATQGPLFASFASFCVGTVALAAMLLLTRTPLPGLQQSAALPAWLWSGGVIGAAFVLGATLLIPRLGAAALVCLVVFGQIVGALLLDRYGVLQAAKPIDAMRLIGAALVAVGALMVVRPWQAP